LIHKVDVRDLVLDAPKSVVDVLIDRRQKRAERELVRFVALSAVVRRAGDKLDFSLRQPVLVQASCPQDLERHLEKDTR
jgi:hypothetical protein